jgi:hypothetical protein
MSEDEFRKEVISFIEDNDLKKANTSNIVIFSTTTKNLPLSA